MSNMEYRLSSWIGICTSVLLICTILARFVSVNAIYNYTAEANDMYKLTSLNSTWDNACFSNGPAVIDGIQFYPMKFPPNISSTIGSGRAWIGYYQRFGYFNLLGCFSGNVESSLSLIDNTPGRCATACGSCNYIGLEDDICHCLKETDIGTLHFKNAVTCSMKMCKRTHFFCGIRGQMWVYGVNNGNAEHLDQLSTSSNNENRCLSAHYNVWLGGAVWKFSSCTDHYKSLCELNNTVLDFATYGLASWDEAVLNCFNKSEIPARFDYYHFRRYHTENFNEAWTAYIRDEVIQKKGLESIPEGRIRCLSLSVSDGQPELRFENCEENLSAVCLAEDTTTTAATMTSIITSIGSTTLAEVATSVWSKFASSSSTMSALYTRQFADSTKPTSSEPQSISGKSSVPSTSIGINKSSGSIQGRPENKSAIVNSGITPGTTTKTTTTAATMTRIITSIGSTTSAEVATFFWSKVASSSSITFTLSTRPFADIKTPTSSEPQSISGKSSLSSTSTSIGINGSSDSTQELPSNKSAIVNNEFPMFGRIGLGIIVVLIIAGIFLVIQRCKKKRIDKGIYCSHQTSFEPSDHTSGMKSSDSVKLDVMNFEDNEMHNADKDASVVCDRQPDSDYYTIHIDDKARQETSRVLCDSKNQSYLYATVDISKKGVPKLI